ncbi:VWA domain-containing protein [Rhizobium sp. S95]|uniref:VWA domain-containing protein n=1 Tax=Ciceribacter sichuanensis TaxID=2949647 RepID=A0AAJ1BY96_9HYPH|nr:MULTISPECIES: TadE/TadG family type IV pilus assembly protein [unclassified Ciceribacter]MCM2398464.1 VWA domain-containing protein [Ciceribacter sp. S95]MCO5958469.1 VWA domain-containing protein [Ciceribacter sp. S101]
MTGFVKRSTVVRRFVSDRNGNFGMMTAILLPVTLAVAGLAMDMTQVIQVRSALQDAADSAALSAASALASDETLTDEQAIERARKFMAAQFANTAGSDNATDDETQSSASDELGDETTAVVQRTAGTNGASNVYDVTVSGYYDVPMNAFTRLLGRESMRVSVSSKAESTSETRSAMSMYLALDRSGSMSFVTDTVDTTQTSCVNYTAENWAYKDVKSGQRNYIKPTKPCYVRKIDALKTAAGVLFTTLHDADPDSAGVRVGAVSYNDTTQSPSAIAWGTTSAAAYVSALPSVPTGGTNATGAMKIAYDALTATNATEATAQAAKDNKKFERYILLMTDGEMTGTGSSWNSSIDSQVRGYCAQAKTDGIKIFSVAFMAPDKGKSLLNYCASDTSYYFEPDDMDELVSAFKEIGKKASEMTTRLTN